MEHGRWKRSRWVECLSPSVRIALVYVVLAGGWILFSDRLVAMVAPDLVKLTGLQTAKGLAFVFFTAALLHLLVRRALRVLLHSSDALRVSEARLHNILGALDEVAMELDASGKIHQVWAAEENLLRMPSAEMVGRKLAEVLGTELAGRLQEAVTSAIQHGHAQTLEYPLDVRAGKRWFLARVNPVPQATGSSVPSVIVLARDITARREVEEALRQENRERRRVEDALRASEQDLATTLRSIGEAVIATDMEGCVKRMNPEAETLTGWREAEALGKPLTAVMQMLDEERGGNLSEVVQSMFRQDGAGLITRTLLVARDGRSRPAVTTGAPLRDAAGKQCGVVMVFRDMTSIRRAEEEIRKFKFIVDQAGEEFYLINPDGSLAYINEATARSLGYGVDELMKMNLADFTVDGSSSWHQGMARLRRGEDLQFETVHRRKDGRRVHKEIKAVQLAIGNREYICGFGRDITARKDAEREIADLATFMAENPSPVLRVGGDGTLLYANAASGPLLKAWGCQPKDHVPAEPRMRVILALERGTTAFHEVAVDGRIFLFTLAPVRSAGYVNLYGSDITERKRLEEQLLQAQKMEAVGRLAGGVAHDFNNLLTAISGYGQLVLEGLADGDTKHLNVQEMLRAADRAAALTRQLLTFSRKQVLQPQLVNLNAQVEEMGNLLRRLIGEDIRLTLRTAPDLGRLRADPNQLEQVILNLALNARDAMPHGGHLVIETGNVDLQDEVTLGSGTMSPGRYVRLTVTDTGCGMDDFVLKHVFEPFFTTKGPGQGTGLGLSTVYGVVKQSGGAIDVRSNLGCGTTFTLYFPLVESAEIQPHREPSGRPDGGSETILLVEDEEMVRELFRQYLQRHNYRVVDAAHGKEALEKAVHNDGPIHLLVTDMVMPGMSGADLAERLKKIRPDIKVLFVSGYSETVGLGETLGPDVGFLQKPISQQAFLRKVREILERPVGAHDGEQAPVRVR